jgi:HSP20 family protein
MQEHSTKKESEGSGRRRGAPVRIADPRSVAGPEAVQLARLELARAEQSLYNLTGHVPGLPTALPNLHGPLAFPGALASPWPSASWAQNAWAIPPTAAYSPTSLAGFAGLPRLPYAEATHLPPCDIADEGNEFVAQVELPGVHADQVEVLAFGRTLIVQATPDTEVDVAALVQRERGSGTSVQRAVLLPAEIQPSGARARLRDGILTVTLPKVVPTEAPRRVEVQD